MSDAIVLVGLPGSGKSAVGRLVAERLGRPFIDQQGITDRTQTGTREAFRATAFYRLNLAERGPRLFGLTLGNHVLTGLFNRSYFDRTLVLEYERLRRAYMPMLSLCFLDVEEVGEAAALLRVAQPQH